MCYERSISCSCHGGPRALEANMTAPCATASLITDANQARSAEAISAWHDTLRRSIGSYALSTAFLVMQNLSVKAAPRCCLTLNLQLQYAGHDDKGKNCHTTTRIILATPLHSKYSGARLYVCWAWSAPIHTANHHGRQRTILTYRLLAYVVIARLPITTS